MMKATDLKFPLKPAEKKKLLRRMEELIAEDQAELRQRLSSEGWVRETVKAHDR